eukprot:UN20349
MSKLVTTLFWAGSPVCINLRESVNYSFSGLGTVVNRDIPPYVTVAGNHARAVSINKNGLQRRGFSKECINAFA